MSDEGEEKEGRVETALYAEAVWWRCHRALIADYLKSVGVSVYHIMGAGTNKPHPYTLRPRS